MNAVILEIMKEGDFDTNFIEMRLNFTNSQENVVKITKNFSF